MIIAASWESRWCADVMEGWSIQSNYRISFCATRLSSDRRKYRASTFYINETTFRLCVRWERMFYRHKTHKGWNTFLSESTGLTLRMQNLGPGSKPFSYKKTHSATRGQGRCTQRGPRGQSLLSAARRLGCVGETEHKDFLMILDKAKEAHRQAAGVKCNLLLHSGV